MVGGPWVWGEGPPGMGGRGEGPRGPVRGFSRGPGGRGEGPPGAGWGAPSPLGARDGGYPPLGAKMGVLGGTPEKGQKRGFGGSREGGCLLIKG